MSGIVQYYFEWDPNKAKTNIIKHKVGFERAASIFLDPLAITIFDEAHSEMEERWVTIGIDRNGILLVVVHTFQKIEKKCYRIRVINARKATKKRRTNIRRKTYEEGV